MPNPPRFELGSGLPGMPNLGGLGKRILQLAVLLLAIILLVSSTTSIPTGNLGVLTLFGKVTGEVLPEGIPSNEGLILALDTSLLFHLNRDMAAQV
jgi:regulator of protease activity HflC (stomatin/prohibitin superfamily)